MEEAITKYESIGTKISFQEVATTMAKKQLLKSENYKCTKACSQANLLLSKIAHNLSKVDSQVLLGSYNK